MSSASVPSSKYRRTWFALVVGVLALVLIFFLSVLAEPILIGLADVAPGVEPRSSAGGWANSKVWLVATGVSCLAILAVGYITKRLSPLRSLFAPMAVLALVLVYVFFAQFPATKSAVRIALWSAGLPISLIVGVWIAARSDHAA